MTTEFATVTGRGQVTIPARIRRRLGLKVGMIVEFVVDEEDGVWIKPLKHTIETAYASIPPRRAAGDDYKSVRREVWEDRVDKAVREVDP